MFTGIIKEVGRVFRISKKGNVTELAVRSKNIYSKVDKSGSVSVNGVCLTLVKKERNILYFEVISPTLKISNLKRLKPSDYVNLEPALSLDSRLDGHFVLGHVDCEAKIKRIKRNSSGISLTVNVLAEYRKYLIPKGSVSVDGISLTIYETGRDLFTVNIIPYTWNNTNLKYRKAGAYINLEFDYLVKSMRLGILKP